MQVFHPFFKRFSHLFFTFLRTILFGNASTFPFRRKCISPETQVRFPSNAEAFLHKHGRVFFVQTYISMPQKAENHAKTLLSNKINITFATLLQKTRAYLPGLVHGSGNGEARPEHMDCAPPTNETGNSKT